MGYATMAPYSPKLRTGSRLTGMSSQIGEALSDVERANLREAIERVGERHAEQASGVCRNTLVRAVSGLRVQRGSRALIRAWLSSQAEAVAHAS